MSFISNVENVNLIFDICNKLKKISKREIKHSLKLYSTYLNFFYICCKKNYVQKIKDTLYNKKYIDKNIFFFYRNVNISDYFDCFDCFDIAAKYNHNVLELLLYDKFLTKKSFTNKLKYFFFSAIKYNDKSLQVILNHPYFNKNMMLIKNKINYDCISYAIINNPLSLKIILNSKYMSKKLLYNIIDDTIPFLLACEIYNCSLEILINSKYMSKKLANFCYNNMNCLTVSAQNEPINLYLLLDNEYITNKTINFKNNDGNNFILLLTYYYNKEAIDFIKSDYMKKKYLFSVNNKNENILMIALRYNFCLAKEILKHKYFKNKLLYEKNIYGDCCLNYFISSYEENKKEKLNELIKINKNIKKLFTNVSYNGKTLLHDICSNQNSIELFEFFYNNTKIDKSKKLFIRNEIDLNLYYPDRIKKYITKEKFNKSGFTYLHILAIHLPNYFFDILKKINKQDLLNLDNSNRHCEEFLLNGFEHVLLKQKKKMYHHVTSIINKKILKRYSKEITNNLFFSNCGIDNTICKKCYKNKLNSILSPCGHMICHKCSITNYFVICPFCNTSIIKKTKIFL